MFERFTERARRVLSLSRQEAQRLRREYIGTEHILLGIIQEGGGVAAKVLKNLNVDLKRIRQEIENLISPSTSPTVTLGQLPFSPRAKRVIELASEASSQLGHDVIGTEHLLLGLMRAPENIATQALINLGLKTEEVRHMILEVLGQLPPRTRAAAAPKPHLEERNLRHWPGTYRSLCDRPELQNSIATLLRQGRSIALVGPKGVGKTSLVMALSRASNGPLTYWSIDFRMFDESYGTELAKISRPGTVCFIPEGELLTASRSVDAGQLGRRSNGGERLILEFREGGLEAFVARYPTLGKDLEIVTVNPPDREECRQLLESARLRLNRTTGIDINESVLQETDRLAREKWPALVPPWATVITLWKAESIQREEFGRGDAPRLQKDIESLEEAGDAVRRHEAELLRSHLDGLRRAALKDLSIESVRLAIAELSGQSSNDLK